MEKKQLYVSEDAPEVLKETIGVAQRMLEAMEPFRIKAENGTLTFADLDELAQLNDTISGEFPRTQPPETDPSPLTSDMDELEAITQARSLEAEELLAKSGGPAFRVESLKDLEALAALPPHDLGEMLLDAAKKKQKAESTTEPPKWPPAPQKVVLETEFSGDLIKENLEKLRDLLYQAKLILFDLQGEWPAVEPFEEKARLNARAFKNYRKEGDDLLPKILSGEEKDEELADKQQEAAFILALIATTRKELEELVSLWQNKTELAPCIVNALKYAANPLLPQWMEQTLASQPPPIQAGFIEVLAYYNRFDSTRWGRLTTSKEPVVRSKILHAQVNSGIPLKREHYQPLLLNPETDYFEEVLFASLLAGDQESILTARRQLMTTPDKALNLPLYLACAGGIIDFKVFKQCLLTEKLVPATIRGLGLLGLTEAVPTLIELFADKITDKQVWDRQCQIKDSLNLITGADLPLLFPEIKEGPAGKEYEVTVEIAWKEQWYFWWIDHQDRFETGIRYRRGQRFTLESCLEEMACPRGNYWSRQYSYYELQIRSGQHSAPFFADWDVKDQLAAIERWKQWWEANQHQFRFSQWFFNGKDLN